jgi:hypothetical protein
MDPSVPVDLFAGPDFGLLREDFALIGDNYFPMSSWENPTT